MEARNTDQPKSSSTGWWSEGLRSASQIANEMYAESVSDSIAPLRHIVGNKVGLHIFKRSKGL